MQKTLRDEHRAQTDLLWCKNRYMTNAGPNRPPLMQKTLNDKHRALTGLLWCKKGYLTNTGPQLTFYMFRYYGKSHYPCMMASRFTGIHQKIWICDRKGPQNCVFRPNFSPNDHNIKTKCFFVVSGCTKRQILRIHPPENLDSEVCEFVIIYRFVARF